LFREELLQLKHRIHYIGRLGASQNNNLGRIDLNVDIKYSEFERQMFFLDMLEILVSTKLGGGDFGMARK
jgi:hypothetical protein